VSGSNRILVVDDDRRICRVLHAILVEHGFEVWCARTAKRALDFIRSENLDLIILDLNLPDISGIELCRTIRTTYDMALIVLTARGVEGDEVAVLDAGADDYVTKPFDASVLMARVRAHLRRRRPKDGLDLFVTDDFAIDFGERTVTRQQQKMQLRRKEYELLRYFVMHRGEAMSHQALLRAIWGQDYREESGLLQLVIMKLRKKIEPDPNLPRYILTIPWFGYRFESPIEEREPSGLLSQPMLNLLSKE